MKPVLLALLVATPTARQPEESDLKVERDTVEYLCPATLNKFSLADGADEFILKKEHLKVFLESCAEEAEKGRRQPTPVASRRRGLMTK